MQRQTTVVVAVAFALAVTLGVRLGNGPATATPSDSSAPPRATTSTVPPAFFVAPGETVVGPVVVIAHEPRLEGAQLVVNFDIQGLAPIADALSVVEYAGFGSTREVLPQDLDTVFLDTWVLTTAAGEIRGSVANPAARAARFDVGPDFELGAVTEFAIASYALLTPVDAAIALAPGSETIPVAPGVTAHLLAITEQDNVIVQVELLSNRGFNLDTIAISGAGPGWVSGVREAEGRPRWNLTYDSPQVPSPIALTVSGSIWMPVDERIPVTVGTSE